jgi:hypothetical protein
MAIYYGTSGNDTYNYTGKDSWLAYGYGGNDSLRREYWQRYSVWRSW